MSDIVEDDVRPPRIPPKSVILPKPCQFGLEFVPHEFWSIFPHRQIFDFINEAIDIAPDNSLPHTVLEKPPVAVSHDLALSLLDDLLFFRESQKSMGVARRQLESTVLPDIR